jgi:hypothetical protein
MAAAPASSWTIRAAWSGMEAFLRNLPTMLPEKPRAILVVSGHWETDGFAFTGAEHLPLIYDYSGFPPHTYRLRYDAPGAPALAARAVRQLTHAGITSTIDPVSIMACSCRSKWRFRMRTSRWSKCRWTGGSTRNCIWPQDARWRCCGRKAY